MAELSSILEFAQTAVGGVLAGTPMGLLSGLATRFIGKGGTSDVEVPPAGTQLRKFSDEIVAALSEAQSMTPKAAAVLYVIAFSRAIQRVYCVFLIASIYAWMACTIPDIGKTVPILFSTIVSHLFVERAKRSK